MKNLFWILPLSFMIAVGCTDGGDTTPPPLDTADTSGSTDSNTGNDTSDDTGVDTGADTGSDTSSSTDEDTEPVGPCYDLVPNDGLGCYGQAQAGACADEYGACGLDAGCTALETCLNTDCAGKTGTEWTDCDGACRTANAGGEALWDAFQQCIYCDECAEECAADAGGKGCEIPAGWCDENKTACYGEESDGTPACWGCAMNAECKDEVDACKDSVDCTALETCLEPCNAMSGTEWQTCTDGCKATHSGGVALLAAYHACIYCDACPTVCAADAAGKCI